MSLQSELFALLQSVVEGRMYPLTGPQPPVTPYITYQVITDNDDDVLDESGGFNPIINARVQIDVYDMTNADAWSLAKQVKAAMGGWSVQNVSKMRQEFFESDTKLYRVMSEFSIWYYDD